MKTLGVIKESAALETRCSLTPAAAASLIKAQVAHVVVEQGLGARAGFSDQEYLEAGARIVPSRSEVVDKSDIITAIDGWQMLPEPLGGKTVIGLFDPHARRAELKDLKAAGATIMALELIPRISRAQSMDVLSSQASIAGYVAVVLAAGRLNKVIPLMMTAAGTIKPASVLVLGAGVAGLQAIATAKRLGAVVFGYDVRSVVKEQVESLGAKFVKIASEESGEGQGGYAKALSEEAALKQRARLTAFAADMDIIITTAQIPGRKAPLLLDEELFTAAKNEPIIIDMAATSGGNIAMSVPNEWRKVGKAWLYGADNLSRQVPKDASFTFSQNICALVNLFMGANNGLDLEDEILREAVICHDNKWVNKTMGEQ